VVLLQEYFNHKRKSVQSIPRITAPDKQQIRIFKCRVQNFETASKMTSSQKLITVTVAVFTCMACIPTAHAHARDRNVQVSRKLLPEQKWGDMHVGHALFKLVDREEQFKITHHTDITVMPNAITDAKEKTLASEQPREVCSTSSIP
jgi:hypothetical protein